MHDCQEEISRQEDVEVQAPGGGGGGGGWSGTVMANHSEGLARILARPTLSLCPAACQSLRRWSCPAQEGVTALQVELLETKLRVNNMAARMGINTRSVHVQTHISYQPSNQLKLQNVDGEIGGSGLGQPAPWEQGSGVSTSFFSLHGQTR